MIPLDERRDVIVPGDEKRTIEFSAGHFGSTLAKAIAVRGKASVALSGGHTPKTIYQAVSTSEHRNAIDWTKVYLFWSDERSVPPTDPESNYKMAMDAGLKNLGIPPEHIFRMPAEGESEADSNGYEEKILKYTADGMFDLVMLGMGDDGHTASLFPATHALQVEDQLVVANFIPQLHTWRMTLTYPGIHASRSIAFYVLGKKKAAMVKEVLTGPYDPIRLPSQKVGTPQHKALWILDTESSSLLNLS